MSASVAQVARSTDPLKPVDAFNEFYARVCGVIQRVIPTQGSEDELRDQQHECYGVIAATLMHGLISLEQHNALGIELARLSNKRLAELRGVVA